MKLLTILNYVSKTKVVVKIAKVTKNNDPEKLKKVEIVKKLNKENKLLFGPVLKNKKERKKPLKDVKLKCLTEHEKASEFYWLIQNKAGLSNLVKSNKINNQLKSKLDISKNKLNENIKVNIQNDTKTLSNFQSSEKIPFSPKGLKQIFHFPLIIKHNNFIEKNEQYTGILPSVGKILSSTMSQSARKALIEWKLSKIKELGQEGFNNLQKEHFRKGKELHLALESYLNLKIEPEAGKEVFTTWKSISPILQNLKPKAELIEAFVEHPFLKYKGVVDCVSYIGPNLTAIEWKKSDNLKLNVDKTYDAPVQLAAYLGALNSDPKYKFAIKTGYIAVAYTNGIPGNLFKINELEMQKYWLIWLQRLQEYWIRTRDGTLPDPI